MSKWKEIDMQPTRTTVARLHPLARPLITARIFKVWNAANARNKTVFVFDFVLIDEEGTAIEGTVDVEGANKIRSRMVEGKIYDFTRFKIDIACTSYRQLKVINSVREYQKSQRTVRLREIGLQNEW